MTKINEKLTYANVVATLALFIAVGGTSAYAANQLSANSVGTKQLKNGAVTKVKLADGVQGERGPEGKQGLRGPQGNPGAPGAPGESGATHAVVRGGDGSGGPVAAVVKCEPGEIATGGGGYTLGPEALGGGLIESSVPVYNSHGEPTGWEVTASSANGDPGVPEAYVVCVSP